MPRVATGVLLSLALARLLLHLLFAGRYGFDRDELAFLDDAGRLAWGYVAYPPVTPFLAHVSMQVFGDSLAAFRVPTAVAQALATLVTGLMARELGGHRMAQAVAAITIACSPFAMVSGTLLSYSGIDYLWWILAAWMLLKIANGGDPKWWLGLGVVIGLGMMTRYTMLACAIAIATSVLATPLRRQLATPWPWTGAALSLLVFAPNAWWQWRNGFVYLDFFDYIHARDMAAGLTSHFLSRQLDVGASPFTAPLWMAGLAWLVFAKDALRARALAWFFAVAFAIFWLAHARSYYLAPAYPMLLAAGAVVLERGIDRLRPRVATLARAATATVLFVAFVATALFALPLAPVGSRLWRAEMPRHLEFADRIGWQEMVAEVARVYHALPEAERARTAIFVSNYGEAGALDWYGPPYRLPAPISQVNSYWARGYGNPPPKTVIVVGSDATYLARMRATCVVAGRIRNAYGIENQESERPDIFVCRDLRFEWSQSWPRKFG